MYNTPLIYHNKLKQGFKPSIRVVIQTLLGRRAYGIRIEKKEYIHPEFTADGEFDATGTVYAAARDVYLEIAPRLLRVSSVARSLVSSKRGVPVGLTQKTQSNVSVSLDNTDSYFTRLMVRENFLKQRLSLHVGFDTLKTDENFRIYKGVVDLVSITPREMRLTAIEE